MEEMQEKNHVETKMYGQAFIEKWDEMHGYKTPTLQEPVFLPLQKTDSVQRQASLFNFPMVITASCDAVK